MIRSLPAILALLAACALSRVCAHSIWIEPNDSGQMVIRFAEPDGRLEQSPGYLDNLTPPVAFIFFTNGPTRIEALKKPDHFLLVGASATQTTCVETSFTVRGGRKPCFYARWQPEVEAVSVPLLTLDLLPTGRAGEVRAYFRGKPLGGITATLRLPDEKELKLTADPDGILRFDPRQSGQYLLTIAHHRETLAGFHIGIAYQETSHNVALTWRQL